MLDDNWDLVNGKNAHHIEQLNGINTINMIEALLTYLSAESQRLGGVPSIPNAEALKELHRSSTIFLLRKPGMYREENVVLKRRDGTVTYVPPDFSLVERHMEDFFIELQKLWHHADALDVAAFALWRLNWIHPFKNGNGRTARAFCYTCLCGKLKVTTLPGTVTVIDRIMGSRDVYEACLRDADKAYADGGRISLSSMKSYLDSLLQEQMQSSGDMAS